jgi:hypothetical protein
MQHNISRDFMSSFIKVGQENSMPIEGGSPQKAALLAAGRDFGLGPKPAASSCSKFSITATVSRRESRPCR